MFCKYCGRQLPDGETVCPGCGTKRSGGSTYGGSTKDLPDYTKEGDHPSPEHADDTARKKSGLSGFWRSKFGRAGSPDRDAGDDIVRLRTERKPAAPAEEPTGFVNPLKDSGKTVFQNDGMQPPSTEAGRLPPRQDGTAAPQDGIPIQPDAPSPGDGEPTGFVNPFKASDQNIHWGSDGDRNQEAPDTGEIETHMGFAILATVLGCCQCCCFPLGVLAIVFASMASQNLKNGDFEQAKKNADIAKVFCWIAVGIWLLSFVGGIIFNVFSALYGTMPGVGPAASPPSPAP